MGTTKYQECSFYDVDCHYFRLLNSINVSYLFCIIPLCCCTIYSLHLILSFSWVPTSYIRSISYVRLIFSDQNIPPRKFLAEYSPPGKFPPQGSWLCVICRWGKPVPTRVLNPNASEASSKPKERSYRKTWEGGIFRRGVYLEPLFQCQLRTCTHVLLRRRLLDIYIYISNHYVSILV